MKFSTFVGLVSIVGVVIAFLNYIKVEPNALDEISSDFRAQATADIQGVDLSVDIFEMSDTQRLVYNQYKAVRAMDDSSSKDEELCGVVKNCLHNHYYKLAISCAIEIGSSYKKDEALELVVDSALSNGDVIGYAILAAENMESSYDKNEALEKINKHYYYKSNPSAYSAEPSEMEQYKEVYRFAYSMSFMDMTRSEAKQFADEWMKKWSYADFLLFKDVFKYADSVSYLDMSEKDAKIFALDWISNRTRQEFEVFQNAYRLADVTMDLSGDDALDFAFTKMKEICPKQVQ